MQRQPPFKNLVLLNWVVTTMFSLLVFLYLSVILNSLHDSFLRSLESFLFMGLVCFSNTGLLRFFTTDGRLPKNQKLLLYYLLSYVLAVLVWVITKNFYSFITGEVWEGEANKEHSYPLAILAVCVINTMVVTLHRLIVLQHIQSQSEIENLQLKANVIEQAHLLLRQQTQPHFLFNALNTIKSLYKRDAKQGEEYLIHLANFLRVSLSNHKTQLVPVQDEIDICINFLSMQKARFGTALQYHIDVSMAGTLGKYLPSFSLQPLVENVLKHNDLTEEKPIIISIYEQNGYLHVSNNLQEKQYKEMSTGVGLSNLAERYQLLSGETVQIQSDENRFTVAIKLLNK